jgi:hypothetical protein
VRKTTEVRSLCALPAPTPIASETPQGCLETIVISAPHPFELGVFFDEAPNYDKVTSEVVVGPRAFGSQFPERGELIH